MANIDDYGDPVEEIKNDGSGGNFLTKKYGPLPVWAWTVLGAGSLYLLYRYGILGGTGTGSATTTSNTTLPASTSDITSGGDAGQTPEEIQGIQDLWDALATINDTLAAYEPIAPVEPTAPAAPAPAAPAPAPAPAPIVQYDPMAELYANTLAYMQSGEHPLLFDSGDSYYPPGLAPVIPTPVVAKSGPGYTITKAKQTQLYNEWKAVPGNAGNRDSWWAMYLRSHNASLKG